MRIIFVPIFLSLFFTSLAAQDSIQVLTKNFQFEDGIYFSFEDFQKNQPSLTWEEVDAVIYSNPQNFMTQVQYIKNGKTEDAELLDLEKIWGLSLGGIPYIRLEKKELDKVLTVFAGLRLRGKICYFNYEKEVKRQLEMPVYNPQNQKVFRTAIIERVQTIIYEKMLHFETGAIEDFNPQNFIRWIVDDERLVETMLDMTTPEIEEKLFKCLLIYVDRNEVDIHRD